jgi:hypothetical protein
MARQNRTKQCYLDELMGRKMTRSRPARMSPTPAERILEAVTR